MRCSNKTMKFTESCRSVSTKQLKHVEIRGTSCTMVYRDGSRLVLGGHVVIDPTLAQNDHGGNILYTATWQPA